MAFKRLVLTTNYQGKEYNFDIDCNDVQLNNTTLDNMWQYWTTIDNFTFEIEGRVSIGGYPLPEGLYVHIYLKNDRIAGDIPNIVKVEKDEEIWEWEDDCKARPGWLKKEVGIRYFDDLFIGDAIYYTNGWELYKLTIGDIERNADDIYFYFEHNNEYFNLNAEHASDEECITHIIVPYEKLCEFALSFDGCEGRFWTDRLKCKEFVAYHLKRVQESFDKIGQSYYKWICNSSCSGENENGWNTELTKSEKTYKSKEECYSAMREDAMASINSFAISDSEMKGHQKVVIEFLDDDAIWVNVGDDIHYTYNIVEC